MNRVLLTLAAILLPSWSHAELIEVSIPIEGLQNVVVDGEAYPGFSLEIPTGVTSENFLTGQLEVSASRSLDCEEDFFEIQVAHLEGGVPVAPSRKTGFVSGFSSEEGTTNLYLDLSSILRHCLGEENQEITVILGALSNDVSPCADLAALDSTQGIWSRVRLLTRD